MSTPIIMPRQGQSVESCIIGKWHKAVGDPVVSGEKLFTYETDKAVFDETAPVAGTLLARFYEEGDDVPCLLVVCVIGVPGEDVSAFDPRRQEPADAGRDAQPDGARSIPSVPPVAPVAGHGDGSGAVAVSPRARTLADRLGVDPARGIAGTGPDGRVIERDVRAAAQAGSIPTPAASALLSEPGAGALSSTGIGGRTRAADVGTVQSPLASTSTEPVDRPYTLLRKSIGIAMRSSLGGMAQLTLDTSFDATDLLALRSRMKTVREAGQAAAYGLSFTEAVPSVNDLIVFAVSRVLKRHPLLNAHGFEDHVRLFDDVHIGIAVDTPRGLMVPVIRHADRMDATEIARQTRALAEACRGGAISPDLLRDGTFTVTNLGAFGIESFTPVINPPQTAILGVCAPQTRLRALEGDPLPSAYTAIPFSLTFDHRALDGADAARFLQELTKYLANISAFQAG